MKQQFYRTLTQLDQSAHIEYIPVGLFILRIKHHIIFQE